MPPFDAMDASLQQAKEPKANVIVAGGGPAGLVCAIMLGRRGVPTVVIEPQERLPGWKAAHSNVIHLNTRGQSALQCAAARALLESATHRRCVYAFLATLPQVIHFRGQVGG